MNLREKKKEVPQVELAFWGVGGWGGWDEPKPAPNLTTVLLTVYGFLHMGRGKTTTATAMQATPMGFWLECM